MNCAWREGGGWAVGGGEDISGVETGSSYEAGVRVGVIGGSGGSSGRSEDGGELVSALGRAPRCSNTSVRIVSNFTPEEGILGVYDTVELVTTAAVKEQEAKIARGHEREECAVGAGREDMGVLRVKCNPISSRHVLVCAAMIEKSPRRNVGTNDRMT